MFELDADAMADPAKDLAVRADALPLPPSSSYAMSHEGRCRGARIGAAGHTIISWVVAGLVRPV
jgi:hypothetical protein